MVKPKKNSKQTPDKVVGGQGEKPGGPPAAVPETNEFWVEHILDKKLENGVWKYFVKWYGWPSETNTWEPVENLSNCPLMLKEFETEWESKNKASHGKQGDGSASAADAPESGFMDFDILEKCPKNKYLSKIFTILDIEGIKAFLVEFKPRTGPTTDPTDQAEDVPDRCLVKASTLNQDYPQMVIEFYVKHAQFKSVGTGQ